MPLIFVNYRTNDEEATATLVDRELSRIFGEENVFRASKSIRPGSRYPQELLKAVRRTSVLLVVIGHRWLEAGGTGTRGALEDENDWTRREIEEALENGAVVIPLLVAGARRLRSEDLPVALGDLADCQYRRLDHRNAAADLGRLADDLIALLPELATAARNHGHGDDHGDMDGNGTARAREGSRTGSRAGAVSHRRRGGMGNLNGDFSGTFVSDPRGPVHTGSGHLYAEQRPDRGGRPVDGAR
ncbi:toll/interleukin-1 receptor domain-containing protein [Streptomyces sp. NBC_00654]|uniref:toll/interleukin-1 receptor domain-containing protein n=1 Tax=Streptomyces sp. NBC_00654 TaxID=2975799 RepID=UPI0022500CAB|nr:toll/interleukin-1 receptor domain-containing protein [Streptomyces sp. NBC_00654]MCX4970456.1 toll/interleukin-1 receptor domain-containing protein [Streptomyces sp. NBC_00654]